MYGILLVILRLFILRSFIMSSVTPPGQRPPHLRDDEPIALLVAFLAFGAIGFWAFNEYQSGRLNSNWLWQAQSSTPVVKASAPSFNLGQPESKPKLPTQKSASVSIPQTQTTLESIAKPPKASSPVVAKAIAPQQVNPAPTLSAPVVSFSTSTSTTSSSSPASVASSPGFFTDVPTTHWAYSYIKTLADRKLTEGFPDNTYHPDELITRSGYAAMIDQAFKQPNPTAAKEFKDVQSGDPRSQAVTEAVESHFMSGYPNSTFKPDQKISRTEAIAALVKGLGLKTPDNPGQVLQQYRDRATIPKWAQPKYAAAIESGLLVDQLNRSNLEPNKSATRAEVAALVTKGLEIHKTP